MKKGKRVCAVALGIVAVMAAETTYATTLSEFCTRYARRNTAYSKIMGLEPDERDFQVAYPSAMSGTLDILFGSSTVSVDTATLEIPEATITLYDFTETSEEGQQTYAECVAALSALEIPYADEIMLKRIHDTSDGDLAAMDEALAILTTQIQPSITKDLMNEAVANPMKEYYLCSRNYEYYLVYKSHQTDTFTLNKLDLVAKQKQ